MQTYAKPAEKRALARATAPARPSRAPPVRPQLQAGLIQRAANLGKRADVFEREADSVAARVASRSAPPEAIAMRAPGDMVQRLSDSDSEPERQGEYLIQPLREGGAADDPAPRPGFLRRLLRLRRGGRALPDPLREDMEAQIGERFDDVRIHTGPEAASLAAEINARAFTIGHDVVFAEGAFQPQSWSGRYLIAHELTHVVQQRGPQPQGEVRQATPASLQRLSVPDLPSISGFVMERVRRFAPRLLPILEKGPFNWLSEQLGGVFGAVVAKVAALDPAQHAEALSVSFGAMLEAASRIISALVSGDCAPMLQALGQMKALALEIAGRAWDRVSAFFAPVGEFFADLWDGISAAGNSAIAWIKRFAGDVWTTIETIGSYIWDKTATIRDYGMGAWDWLSRKLFGPEDASAGESARGIVGWFSDQALTAWDWVKGKARPVWQPVSGVIETVQALIPPNFVAEMGERMTRFADDVESTAEGLGEGNSLAENREALSAVLPSLDGIISAARGVITSAAAFVSRSIGTIASKVTRFMTRLRESELLAWLAGPLGWFEVAIANVSDWAAGKVAKLFEWYVAAFDFLAPFVKRLIELVQKVIGVAADVLLLPQLLLTAAWNLIPVCIRDPVKEFVIQRILGQIPVFSQLLQVGDLWARLQERALQILRSVFVDGDIAKAAWVFFREMLALIGLPAQLVVAILAKAAQAYGMILSDPVGFLINLLRAMRAGFVLFFDNILTHLMAGVVGWLSGAVASAGLTFPSEFSLRAVLGFVLQLLDITVGRVLARLEEKIGKAKVDKLRKVLGFAEGVWEFVRVMIEEGVGGLWRFVQEKLANLWNRVLDSTIAWIVGKIITQATVKLLSFLDPSGIMAVINSCIALYRAIETFIEQLKAILEIVSTVLDGVVGIASGAIDTAAGFLERALAGSLPIAIAFLANQIGLGGLGKRIREFVEALRERVDAAIDWLIDRAIRLGQGFLTLVQSGANLARAGVSKLRDWWRARTEFRNAAGERHSIFIEGRGRNAKVILRSDPMEYQDFLKPADKFNLDTATRKTAYENARTTAAELDEAIGMAASSADARADEAADHGANIQLLVNRLGEQTAIFMPGSAGTDQASSAPVYGPKRDGKYGTSATILRLTPKVPGTGSDASAMSGEWSTLVSRAYRKGSSASYYVRGHLLNRKLGGPGQKWENLTLLTQTANNLGAASHEKNFEAKVKQAVLHDKTPRAVNFVCTVNYGRTARVSQALDFEEQRTPHARSLNTDTARAIGRIIRLETDVPLSMDCSAYEIDNDGKPIRELVRYHVPNQIEDAEQDYHLRDASPRLPVLEINAPDIRDKLMAVRGIGEVTCDRFMAARAARGASKITTNKILDELNIEGKRVFTPTMAEALRKTYRVSFR